MESMFRSFVGSNIGKTTFADNTMKMTYDCDFKQPNLPRYQCAFGDLFTHTNDFESRLFLHQGNHELFCKLLQAISKGEAFKWFFNLKPKSICLYE